MITIITGKSGMGKTLFLTLNAIKLIEQGHDVYANFQLDFNNYIKSLEEKANPEEALKVLRSEENNKKKIETPRKRAKRIKKELKLKIAKQINRIKKLIPFKNKTLKPDNWGNVYFWSEIEELLHIKGGQIFVDEAQCYFDSHNWREMPSSVKQKFATHRHDVKKKNDGTVIPLDIWMASQTLGAIDKRIRLNTQDFVQMNNLSNKLFMAGYYEPKDLQDDNSEKIPLKRRFFVYDEIRAKSYDTHAAVDFIPYPDLPYFREYENKFSNKNTGLLPKTSDTPPFYEWKKKQSKLK